MNKIFVVQERFGHIKDPQVIGVFTTLVKAKNFMEKDLAKFKQVSKNKLELVLKNVEEDRILRCFGSKINQELTEDAGIEESKQTNR